MLDDSYDSLDTLGLSEEALDSLPTADLVIEVTERGSTRPGFYVVVEASLRARLDDVTRASERSRILGGATELGANVVVAAARLAPSVQEHVFRSVDVCLEAGDDNGASWFPTVEEQLERPDPL